MKVRIIIGILVLVLIALVYGVLYSGYYNVAATEPHYGITENILNKIAMNSVKYHSKGINVPDLQDVQMVKRGSVAYDDMCAVCHGAPGIEPSVIGEGLYPNPPDLSESVNELSLQELFWITKNGIKDTGMPAFGPTHEDSELWEIIAFMNKMPEMTPEEYESLKLSAEGEGDGHSHTHGTREQGEQKEANQGENGEHDHSKSENGSGADEKTDDLSNNKDHTYSDPNGHVH